ncbi:MAG TPA: hypothetical protein PKE55_12810 [Kiritimatiellia bacterium]|nr:hypothetical protein [Kiritimatiellia bacterium]
MCRGLVTAAVICLLGLVWVPSTSAALINLNAYVSFSLLQEDEATPLADGSIVQIIGSFDDIIDPMETFGGTNVTGGTTGDDIILATVVINSSQLGSNGTFFVSNIFFETDDINFMYLRFYNSVGPLTGLIYWGQTVMTNINHDEFGVVEVDFVGNYSTTNVNNFVIIPEPSVFKYVLIGCVGFWFVRRRQREAASPQTGWRIGPWSGGRMN